MKRKLNWLVAATLGVGGVAFVGCDRNDTASTPPNPTPPSAQRTVDKTVDRTETAARDTGDRVSDTAKEAADKTAAAARTAGDKVAGVLPSSESLSHNLISDVTEAAMTKGGFDDLVERLSKADRERLHDYANGDNFADLDAKVAQLQADFKARYNHDFDIKDESKVFGNFVSFSELKKDGFNVGTISIADSHGMPAVTLNLESTGTAWKLDIPDTMTGEQLKMSLIKHLDMLSADKASWPADLNEAYRAFAHHVLAALAGK
jgi:hypothetical protein